MSVQGNVKNFYNFSHNRAITRISHNPAVFMSLLFCKSDNITLNYNIFDEGITIATTNALNFCNIMIIFKV